MQNNNRANSGEAEEEDEEKKEEEATVCFTGGDLWSGEVRVGSGQPLDNVLLVTCI